MNLNKDDKKKDERIRSTISIPDPYLAANFGFRDGLENFN
jgi:hypothetical protein